MSNESYFEDADKVAHTRASKAFDRWYKANSKEKTVYDDEGREETVYEGPSEEDQAKKFNSLYRDAYTKYTKMVPPRGLKKRKAPDPTIAGRKPGAKITITEKPKKHLGERWEKGTEFKKKGGVNWAKKPNGDMLARLKNPETGRYEWKLKRQGFDSGYFGEGDFPDKDIVPRGKPHKIPRRTPPDIPRNEYMPPDEMFQAHRSFDPSAPPDEMFRSRRGMSPEGYSPPWEGMLDYPLDDWPYDTEY